MKRIILCFDGTWNKPAEDSLPEDRQVETNVRRFYESLHKTGDDGVQQLPWYDAGVGTEWYNKLTGGAFGALLDKHILDGYTYLVDHYAGGDEVYIVGFSRGAYAARSLVGMIRNCGLVKAGLGALKIGAAYGIYRTRDDGVDSAMARGFRALFSREIKIKFLGVWDTVGALGIPLEFIAKLNAQIYQFHDTRLSRIVENAYQAIALDEHRVDYDICLWDPSERPDQTMEQRWFCGAHCDVGGGYPDRRLSDLALRWMEDKAADLGLALTITAIDPKNYRGTLTDSYGAFLGGAYAKVKKLHNRAVLSTEYGNEQLDASIDQRRRDVSIAPPYGPKNSGLPPIP